MVRQVDHQEQCALMADAWGNGAFVRPDPFGALRDATALHDEGWREWERRPKVNDRGEPIDFPDLDRRVHAAMYGAGIARACALGDRAGLIASLHGRGLYEKRLGLDGPIPPLEGRPAHEVAFISAERDRQARLARRIGLIEPLDPWAWACFRLLQAWDGLSLYLLWGGLPHSRAGVLPQVPRGGDDPAGVPIAVRPLDAVTAALDPYPFGVEPAIFPVAGRWIPDRRYENADDLAEALANAEPETIEVGVTSG